MKKSIFIQGLILCIFLLTSSSAFAKDSSLPWTAEAIKNTVKVGDTLVYNGSGTDSNGFAKPFEFHYEVVKIDENNIELKSRKIDPADGNQYGDGTHDTIFGKDGTSPYFDEMRPKLKVLRTEKLEVPAGNFDCTVVEMKSMFGDIKTVWMINNKPGIYAKVTIEKLIYELKSISQK